MNSWKEHQQRTHAHLLSAAVFLSAPPPLLLLPPSTPPQVEMSSQSRSKGPGRFTWW